MKLVLATDEFKEEISQMIDAAISVVVLASWYQECIITESPDAKEICSDISINLFKKLRHIQSGCEIIPLKDGRRSLRFKDDIQDSFEKLIAHLNFTKAVTSKGDASDFFQAIKEALEENSK